MVGKAEQQVMTFRGKGLFLPLPGGSGSFSCGSRGQQRAAGVGHCTGWPALLYWSTLETSVGNEGGGSEVASPRGRIRVLLSPLVPWWQKAGGSSIPSGSKALVRRERQGGKLGLQQFFFRLFRTWNSAWGTGVGADTLLEAATKGWL